MTLLSWFGVTLEGRAQVSQNTWKLLLLHSASSISVLVGLGSSLKIFYFSNYF